MKIYFSFILFIVFALRPVYNIGCFAYYELNIDYIIEKYCVNKEKPQLECNGKCHLTNQLALNNSDSEDSSPLFTFFDAFYPVYFQKYNSNYNLKCDSFFVKNKWNYNNQFSSVFYKEIDKPPRY